jgi:LPXTG-motif cell wall-anchored protein
VRYSTSGPITDKNWAQATLVSPSNAQVSAAPNQNPLEAMARKLGLVSSADAAGPAAGGQPQQIALTGLPAGGNLWIEVQAVNGASRSGGNLGAISNNVSFNTSSGSGNGGSGNGGSSGAGPLSPTGTLPNTAGSQSGTVILLGLALLASLLVRRRRCSTR